jgi:hypothetical protein
VITSRKLRRVKHVARMVGRRGATGLWWGNLTEGDHLKGPGVDKRIILK